MAISISNADEQKNANNSGTDAGEGPGANGLSHGKETKKNTDTERKFLNKKMTFFKENSLVFDGTTTDQVLRQVQTADFRIFTQHSIIHLNFGLLVNLFSPHTFKN